MQCDNCGERQAAIHLTQIVNNSVTTVHLCEQCAEEKGVKTGATVAKFPLSDFLASMGKGKGGKVQVEDESIPCGSCGGTLQNFRDTGRLGCPGCYDAFSDHLRDLLRRLHGSSQHVGERYTTAGWSEAEGPPLHELRKQLQQAVDSENFELAAEIRDRIRVLE